MEYKECIKDIVEYLKNHDEKDSDDMAFYVLNLIESRFDDEFNNENGWS